MQWLRRLVRRHTYPMTPEYAGEWKQKLSYLYMFLAWNAFGIVGYNMATGKANWATFHGLPKEEGTAAQQWTKSLGIKQATVFKISGTHVERYEVNNEFDDVKKVAIKSVITKPENTVTQELTK